MPKADSVYITPPTNTSAIDHPIMFPPRDPTRRRFLTIAAVGSVVGTSSLAAAAMAPNVPQAVTVPCLAVPAALPDPAFALIANKRAADIAHGKAIDAEEKAEEHGIGLDEAYDRCSDACHAVRAIDWKLATTLPTTLAGVAAVLRFANEIEDGGMEWPNTDGRLASPATGDHSGGDRGLDQCPGRKGGAMMTCEIIQLSAARPKLAKGSARRLPGCTRQSFATKSIS